jgi:hypothetical protein
MRKSLVLATAGAAALTFAAASPAMAQSGSQSYQADLQALNHQDASGTLTLSLNGNKATITEHTDGLAATFMGGPFPHVQHIHGGAQGACPTMSADKNGDGIVDTVEGQPSYGGILTTLSTKGDTSPKAGTNVKTAPAGASYDYSRTITLDSKTMDALKAGAAVVVVHGDDPSKLSKKAQGEKSNLVPSLPLAATAPALCGKLAASQMGAMPAGGVATGGGSTSGIEDQGLYLLGGGLLLAAGATLTARRRLAQQGAK